MNPHDPGTEVWICECGKIIPENAPQCVDCHFRDLVERTQATEPVGWSLVAILVVTGLGMLIATWLMVHAAWDAYRTFH